MGNAVEAVVRTATVKAERGPFRQCWTPVPVGTLDPNAPAPMARALVQKIKAAHRDRGMGSYVFIDPERQVYVLTEDKPAAQQWFRERFGWLVGFYAMVHRPGVPMLKPTPEGLVEDMLEQIEQMQA